MAEIRYGILCTASIVPRFVKGMRNTKDGVVRAIASRDLQKAERFAQELDIPEAYDDYHAILNDEEIDAVYIPSINRLHMPLAKEALIAGKHVIVEKPFALHAEEAKELFELAEEKGLFLTEAIKTPFLPVYEEIRKLIDSGKYGKIQFMSFRQSYTSGPYVAGWNRRKEEGGGVLYGNEAYFFRMAEFFGGNVLSCSGSLSASDDDEAEDQCAVTALMENGSLCSLFVSQRVLFDNGLTLYLDRARIEIPDYWKASRATVTPDGAEAFEIHCPFEEEFHFELDHYNACILEGRTSGSVNTPEKTVRYIGLCEKIYKS